MRTPPHLFGFNHSAFQVFSCRAAAFNPAGHVPSSPTALRTVNKLPGRKKNVVPRIRGLKRNPLWVFRRFYFSESSYFWILNIKK